MNSQIYIDKTNHPRERILDFIKGYIEIHCYPPTVREIAEGVGLKSSASVCEHIKILITLGLLETDAKIGTPRVLRIPNMKLVKV
ncbi:hypothetical protein KQI61_15405 [Anaerocolumna aminovalerica]|uniref:LexA family protein n=1 Tax=Anaerocolumna aminovalerica TaxID=1527 RepID=UPI001C0EE625|nr:hypothetical protein [Anaerocolumna aminovalerica]MBU5333585.1 hypothetical protein [Anaerocolumna aminovalerica]